MCVLIVMGLFRLNQQYVKVSDRLNVQSFCFDVIPPAITIKRLAFLAEARHAILRSEVADKDCSVLRAGGLVVESLQGETTRVVVV